MSARTPYTGPALLSAGFRPFFLLATGFAALAIALWLAVWEGLLSLSSVFLPVDWHVHEMVFGYGAAVVAGFLFTAVPNWTGRLPTRGLPLGVLSLVWIAGRYVSAGVFPVGPVAVLLIDQLFLLLVGSMIAREIVAGRNWRNLKVLVPVTIFWVANLIFHIEAMKTGAAMFAHRLGLAVLVFLIMLIGGRIIPSFTRNWLVKQGQRRLPIPFNSFDGIAILTGALALGLWVAQAEGLAEALLLGLAGMGQALRLARWRGAHTWRSPLLLMLHLSYAFIPFGFAAAALSAVGILNDAATFHALGAGAVGTMTVAVMVRATLGHTGRPLEAGAFATGAFAALAVASLLRVAAEVQNAPREALLIGAGVLWVGAFLVVMARLWRPVLSKRTPAT
ncbi:NnrS family protein [Maritimibacter sp. DP1N21-5]|uniref:NnrS family protein n=1 Tax=Maritimibacter sp. DP1N21-5 TaxID=2836867 RepID=UPI001C47D14F|nr:NnrS family protein [Maritimibacter sp. DP1N21-5]MBV7410060.1 NnrS family protein [Maritimibacter sp. DP1N21-5]